jgi:hypothetical protein
MRVPAAILIERDDEALRLRRRGYSYPKIARKLDISQSTAHAAVGRALQRYQAEMAEAQGEVLALELQRLDSMWEAIAPFIEPLVIEDEDTGRQKLVPPDKDMLDRALKIMDRRAKYLGLDKVNLAILWANSAKGGAAALGGDDESEAAATKTAEDEAREMLAFLSEHHLLPRDAFSTIAQQAGWDVVDADVVEDSDRPALPSPRGDETGGVI